MDTIKINFEREVLPVLPRWAREDPQVVLVCKRDLAFRCDVFAAETAQQKRLLKAEARRLNRRADRQ